MLRVVTIVCPGHSGSTVLETMLSARGALDIGEARSLLRLAHTDPARVAAGRCSCGAPFAQCPLWSIALAAGAAAPPGDARGAAAVVAALRAVECTAVVDSSKDATWALALRDAGAEVEVVRLLRDVRPWALARRTRLGRPNAGGIDAPAARRRLASSVARGMVAWHTAHRHADAALAGSGLRVHNLVYDRLATSAETTLDTLATALDLGEAGETVGHRAFGNAGPGVRRPFVYDDAWCSDPAWRGPYRVLAPVRRYNERQVVGSPALVVDDR